MNRLTLKNIFLILIIMISFISCEKEEVISSDLPFSEKVVIRGFLKPTIDYLWVNFSKTLPLNEEYSIEKSEIKDIIAYIKDTIRVYPLQYTEKGNYRTMTKINFKAGESYELFAVLNSKYYYAKTIVPELPSINGISAISEGATGYLKTNIKTKPEYIYGANWIVTSGGSILAEGDDIYSISEPAETSASGVILRTGSIPSKYLAPEYKGYLGMRVYAFDKQFYNFFKTKNFNQSIKDIFTQNGGPVSWNISGEAIGLFVGAVDVVIIK